MRSAVLLPLLLLAAAPPALAQGEPLCIITFAPSADFLQVEVVVDLVLTDDDLRVIAEEVDADASGTLEASEVAAYEETRHSQRPSERAGERTLLAGSAAEPRGGVLGFGPRLRGFQGAVDNLTGHSVQEVRTYRFDAVGPGPEVFRYEGGGAEEGPYAVVETVVFTAPPGFVVWTVNGTLLNRSAVTLPGFSTRAAYAVEFAPDDHWTRAGADLVNWVVEAVARHERLQRDLNASVAANAVLLREVANLTARLETLGQAKLAVEVELQRAQAENARLSTHGDVLPARGSPAAPLAALAAAAVVAALFVARRAGRR